MAHISIGSSVDRLVGARLGGSDALGARRPGFDALRQPEAVRAVAPKPLRATGEAVESARVLASDLEPLAGLSADALLADMVRLELTLTRRPRSEADAASFEIGAAALREAIRRMRLVQTAGDALVAGQS